MSVSAKALPDLQSDLPGWDENRAADFADLRVDSVSLRRNLSAQDGHPIHVLAARVIGTTGLLPHIETGTINITAQTGTR